MHFLTKSRKVTFNRRLKIQQGKAISEVPNKFNFFEIIALVNVHSVSTGNDKKLKIFPRCEIQTVDLTRLSRPSEKQHFLLRKKSPFA